MDSIIKTPSPKIVTIIISVLALILGFSLGIVYAHKQNSKIINGLAIKVNEKSNEIKRLNDLYATKVIEEPDITPETYTSQNLGISFNYIGTKVQEIGSRIYVYSSTNNQPDEPTKGKLVEVRYKNENETLESVIKKDFFQENIHESCIIKSIKKGQSYNRLFEFVKIIPSNIEPTDNQQAIFNKSALCPATYTHTGITENYFVMDRNHPGKYAFVELGQDNFSAGKNVTWDMTIKFTD